MKTKEFLLIQDIDLTNDLRKLEQDEESKELMVHVMKICGWKEWVPEKFWGVFTKDGINKEKLRQIIENELEKEEVAGKAKAA